MTASPVRRHAPLGVLLLAAAVGLPALAAADGKPAPVKAAALTPSAVPALPPPARPVVEIPGEMEFSGRLVVRPLQPRDAVLRGVDAGAAAANAQRVRDELAKAAIRHYPEVDEFIIPVPAGETEPQTIARMMATGDYQYVTPDWICYPIGVIPTDPLFDNQWHHDVMQSRLGWEVTRGVSQIICAFVDTGIDLTHPDLQPRLVLGYNSVTGLPQDFGGDVSDINGHGTAVAGSAAAIGDNGVGVAGVGWNLRIMPIRTSNSSNGGAFMSNILAGARWAAENTARVVSASYSGVPDPSVNTTGAYIKGLGSLFCFAAGNDAANLNFDHPDTIVVAATAPDDSRAGFSAYGQAIDVAAPGVDVWTTTRGGGYGPASGTSFATPITNGVIAMIWSVNPALTPDQVQSILFASCDDLGEPGEDNQYGHGRVNLFRAVRDAAATLGPRPPYASTDHVRTVAGATVQIDPLANDFDVLQEPLTLISVQAASAQGSSLEVLTGAGPGGRPLVRYTAPTPPPQSGEDSFTYIIRNASNMESQGTVRIRVLDPASLLGAATIPASRPGVLAEYYEVVNASVLPNFATLVPYASEGVAQINFPSTDGVFAGSGRADHVGAVFTGFVRVPAPDLYTFFTSSDDGSKLYIGTPPQLVVDNDGLHGMQERSGQIGLHAGWHPIRVDFFEREGGAGVIASLRGGGLPKQVITAGMLREASCTGDWNRDGAVTSGDISAFITRWLADIGHPEAAADVNADGVVNSADISAFIQVWLMHVGGC